MLQCRVTLINLQTYHAKLQAPAHQKQTANSPWSEWTNWGERESGAQNIHGVLKSILNTGSRHRVGHLSWWAARWGEGRGLNNLRLNLTGVWRGVQAVWTVRSFTALVLLASCGRALRNVSKTLKITFVNPSVSQKLLWNAELKLTLYSSSNT